MAWTVPQYSKAQVDKAGRVTMDGNCSIDDFLRSWDIINNWRSSHSFPLNTFQTTLRNKGRKIDADCLVAQRIKRMSSIHLKLDRFKGLRLSQMQDIGGCRIVLRDIDAVTQMYDTYRKGDLKHTLVRADDYLVRPQQSGYRGVHLIYRYYSDKSTVYNGLLIEVQVRSQFQHAWATAVETVGTFLNQSLKSSLGEAEWLRFFALMGSAIAFSEGTAPVADTPVNRDELIDELRHIVNRLDVINRLEIYGNALQFFQEQDQGSNQYFILVLDPVERKVTVRGYTRGMLEQAQSDYLESEKLVANTPSDAVLVSVDSVAALQRAYPNYFLDTRVFISLLRDALAEKPLTVEDAADLAPETPED